MDLRQVTAEARQQTYEAERRRAYERQLEDEVYEERWTPPRPVYPTRRYYSPY